MLNLNIKNNSGRSVTIGWHCKVNGDSTTRLSHWQLKTATDRMAVFEAFVFFTLASL